MQSLRRRASAWADYYFMALRWLSVVAGFAILVLILYIDVDVGGRYVANRPMPGGVEIAETIMIFIVFMGLAYTFARGGHLSLEFVFERLNPRGQAILDILALLLALLLFGFLTWTAGDWAWRGWELKTAEGYYRVPIYPARFIVAIGAFLFAIQAVIDLIRRIDKLSGMGQLKEQK